ncbi:hypothetical protein M128_2392 [Bacteroides fragilis str. S6L8]|uniref:Uncharacterized protein n=7 Tax=Bacteroides fragilis TaxID=817 RepID=A0A015Y9E4_BACFG|nr:hypothetical protein M101_2100 [Bacteroides fragilis str. 1007-1-F \
MASGWFPNKRERPEAFFASLRLFCVQTWKRTLVRWTGMIIFATSNKTTE